ncbi:MAG TPA: LysE family translocator, partial [Terriglobales bacterium]|nr:LysE family translocator [Terriglobales bacterium]
LARSAMAFSTVKYAGAAYLCFLGVRMILAARRDEDELPAEAARRVRNPFWQGIATEVLNPKTALFFLSFIPQFVNREAGHVFLQFLVLGAISVTLNTSADLVVTMFAGPLGNRIRSSAKFRRAQRTATGAIMIGLGSYLAVSRAEWRAAPLLSPEIRGRNFLQLGGAKARKVLRLRSAGATLRSG